MFCQIPFRPCGETLLGLKPPVCRRHSTQPPLCSAGHDHGPGAVAAGAPHFYPPRPPLNPPAPLPYPFLPNTPTAKYMPPTRCGLRPVAWAWQVAAERDGGGLRGRGMAIRNGGGGNRSSCLGLIRHNWTADGGTARTSALSALRGPVDCHLTAQPDWPHQNLPPALLWG